MMRVHLNYKPRDLSETKRALGNLKQLGRDLEISRKIC